MEVGQIVYLKPSGNQARVSSDIRKGEITKIGRKYFEVKTEGYWRETKFHKEGLRQVTEYTPDWQLYFSEQEILDEKEFNKLVDLLGDYFSWRSKVKLTLEQLRRIKEITDEDYSSF